MAIKVSQATIDKIKKMGMTKALKSAPRANAEMAEGLRRMYGQRRLDAAMGPVKRKVNAPSAISNTLKRSAPGAISGRTPVKKSSAPGAISGRTPVRMPKEGPAVKITQPKKPTVSSASAKAAEARAGGNYKYDPSKKVATKPAKSAADKAKDDAAAVARRKAAASAVKRAGGRSM